MGIIWIRAMPLLTTLAALVLIVHTAEEDLESEYRHDLRPRILDTRTPSYDQTWRAMEAEPIIQPAQNDNWDNKSVEDLPKRRRPGRKRRRRPQASSMEDIEHERYPYPDEPPRPYFDVTSYNARETTEMPTRKRTKPDSRPIRWTDDSVDFDRRLRRRSQRRKRPLLEPWPELSEFNGFRPEDTLNDDTEDFALAKQSNKNEHDEKNHFVEFKDDHRLTNKLILNEKNIEQNVDLAKPTVFTEKDDDYRRDRMKEDKSLSEFSAEIMNSGQRTAILDNDDNPNIQDSYKENSSGTINEYDKIQDKCLLRSFGNKGIGKLLSLIEKYNDVDVDTNYYVVTNAVQLTKSLDKIRDNFFTSTLSRRSGSKTITIMMKCDQKIQQSTRRTLLEKHHKQMDQLNLEHGSTSPLTLKDILKRSNGTSLSEILQQHNLTLADLLHGKENAVSLFKSPTSTEARSNVNNSTKAAQDSTEIKQNQKADSEKELLNSETKYSADPITTTIKDYLTTTDDVEEVTKANDIYPTTTIRPVDDLPKIVTKRRHPPGLRKKLRIRPMLNNTYKAQLSRDLVTLNSRKYSHHRRNITKFKEWKEVVPAMRENNIPSENNITEAETTTIHIPDETTTLIDLEADTNVRADAQTNSENKLDDINMYAFKSTTDFVTNKSIEVVNNVTERPSVVSMPRPTAISSGLRRQAFNNRLKRKRLKNKNSTTEPPQDDIIKHLYGMGDLVSSSEFIARTQEPKILDEDKREHTTLEDYLTTESTGKVESAPSYTKIPVVKTSTTPISMIYTTTEETAKIEIQEILNDTQTSAKLSKILMERNMTLSELVEHRERGSSHVHLADIFHNASREPNPPEPFLSKSLIEPISKETYPLRALLEANLHDPTAKATTIDPSMIQLNDINIPVVMDFRNNVNENAENMGIMSLFNNYNKNTNKASLTDSEGNEKLYEKSVNTVNTTYTNIPSNTTRESRILTENIDDVVSWNEIFSLMRKNHKNETGGIDYMEVNPLKPYQKVSLDEDADGDGLIVLEDLQRFKDFENNVGSHSEEKLELKTSPPALDSSINERLPSQTKSVTVATASIAGLAMILFLLTYAVFKWREQRSNIHKKNSFSDERIPSPVFENRKGHRNNSSMRSISPMLQTSNIYSLNTLDSKAGKESPDYMWDTLRKPYQ